MPNFDMTALKMAVAMNASLLTYIYSMHISIVISISTIASPDPSAELKYILSCFKGSQRDVLFRDRPEMMSSIWGRGDFSQKSIQSA